MANYDLTYEGNEVQKILDTGNELQDAGYIFRGEATPSTVPGTPTERVAYIGGPGTYTNFGTSTEISAGCIGVFKYNGSAWSIQVINTGLSTAITTEAESRANADGLLQNAISAINAQIGSGYVYAGVAAPSTVPVSGKVFYLAITAGTYTNFEDSEETPLAVTAGINILKNTGTGWVLDQIIAIDAEPTQGSDNLVKSGGMLNSIIQNGPAFDLSAYNAQEGVLATYADLNDALTALNTLPADFKKGGMSFKFVHTSDNKYVQYRLMSDTFSTDTDDWAIADEGVYVENPEFIYVKTDAEGKILFGIKINGESFFGVGCPEQIKLYIEEKIAELPLNELIAELNTKVDKEEGKSLIDSDYASSQLTIDNPEYLQLTTDSEDKILEGITQKGVKQINLPIDTPSVSIEHVENPEWLSVTIDSEGRILEGIRTDGTKYAASINKKCLYIGDSISTSNLYKWKGYLEKLYGFSYVRDKANALWPANGGITICPLEVEPEQLSEKSIWYRCAEHRMSIYDFDIISLFGGTNDMWGDGYENVTLGTVDDKPYVDDASSFSIPANYTDVWSANLTFAQCLMGCIEMLKRDFPGKDIIIPTVMGSAGFYGNQLDSNNVRFSERMAIMQGLIAKKYNLIMVPLYWDMRNYLNANIFTVDGVHPNDIGARRICTVFKETLKL